MGDFDSKPNELHAFHQGDSVRIAINAMSSILPYHKGPLGGRVTKVEEMFTDQGMHYMVTLYDATSRITAVYNSKFLEIGSHIDRNYQADVKKLLESKRIFKGLKNVINRGYPFIRGDQVRLTRDVVLNGKMRPNVPIGGEVRSISTSVNLEGEVPLITYYDAMTKRVAIYRSDYLEQGDYLEPDYWNAVKDIYRGEAPKDSRHKQTAEANHSSAYETPEMKILKDGIKDLNEKWRDNKAAATPGTAPADGYDPFVQNKNVIECMALDCIVHKIAEKRGSSEYCPNNENKHATDFWLKNFSPDDVGYLDHIMYKARSWTGDSYKGKDIRILCGFVARAFKYSAEALRSQLPGDARVAYALASEFAARSKQTDPAKVYKSYGVYLTDLANEVSQDQFNGQNPSFDKACKKIINDFFMPNEPFIKDAITETLSHARQQGMQQNPPKTR